MIIGGVDLGFNGAIVTINPDLVSVLDMPTFTTMKNHKERRAYDISVIQKIFDCSLKSCDYVFVEKVQPVMAKFGGTSGASNFHLGFGLGVFQSMLECYKIKYELVPAKEWQKYFGVVRPKDADKSWETKGPVYETAHRLFPTVELATPRGRLLDGRSDALLIAEWGRRRVESIGETHTKL